MGQIIVILSGANNANSIGITDWSTGYKRRNAGDLAMRYSISILHRISSSALRRLYPVDQSVIPIPMALFAPQNHNIHYLTK